MAGLGRKTFVAGDILTAAQVQGYLQDQAIMVYSGTGARGTGILSPSEGMFVYLTDSDNLTYYNGSTWLTYPQSLSGVTLTTPILTNPTITNGTATLTTMVAPEEVVNITANNPSGTVTLDAGTVGITYWSGTATGNWTLNFRSSSTATLNSLLSVGQSITHTFISTQGTPTAFYISGIQIDGTATTVKYQTGAAPSAGNASANDTYTYTIIKTATTPTYLVLGSQVRFG